MPVPNEVPVEDDFDSAFADAISVVSSSDQDENQPQASAESEDKDDTKDQDELLPPAEPAAVAEPAQPPATPEEMEAALLASIPDPVASEEYTAKIEAFKKDWPDIAEAVEMQATHLQSQMEARVARLVSSVVQSIYADMSPIAKSYAKVETNTLRTTVLSAHADYDSVYPNLEPWIKSQPAYLQSGMLHAYNAGSAGDVIDLVSRYKAATGSTPQVHEPAVETQAVKPGAKAAVKAAELIPVATKRTAPRPAGDDPNDYDGAFTEAAESYNS